MILTLNRVWIMCLAQWKWIIEQLDAGSEKGIYDLKKEWFRLYGKGTEPCSYCYFCEYDVRHSNGNCSCCPIKLVNPNLVCQSKGFHFEINPHKFYARLLRLEKRWRAK